MEVQKHILLDVGYLNEMKGVVIHNDSGYMNAEGYYRWLGGKTLKELELGIAHYYVDDTACYQFIEDNKIGWHTASYEGNRNYIGIEVCQSLGDKEQFLKNEYQALQLAVELLKKYNLPINENTVRLHREFSSTDCPHRSVEIHGNAKAYFIETMRKISDRKETKGELDEMEKINIRKMIMNTGYSIDSLPWYFENHARIGTVTEKNVGQVVTLSYELNNYYHSQFLNGWVDYRAFEDVETLYYTATVKNGGYSVDSLPWNFHDNPTFRKYDTTDNLIGTEVTITARHGAYLYAEGQGWIDEKAF